MKYQRFLDAETNDVVSDDRLEIEKGKRVCETACPYCGCFSLILLEDGYV